MEFFSLWKYWKKPFGARDFTLIAIDLHCSLTNRTRIVLFNFGVRF